tara:strand:+ start:129 stop:458 length:330 start_codon:yes stop_codon:yes gene_type:complete
MCHARVTEAARRLLARHLGQSQGQVKVRVRVRARAMTGARARARARAGAGDGLGAHLRLRPHVTLQVQLVQVVERAALATPGVQVDHARTVLDQQRARVQATLAWNATG